MSNILKPSLSRGVDPADRSDDSENIVNISKKMLHFERRFQPVMKCKEPDEEEAIEILKGLRPYYEKTSWGRN